MQSFTQKWIEEKKLIITKLYTHEILTKNVFKGVTWTKCLGYYNHILMNKTIIKNLEEPRLLLYEIFYIFGLITDKIFNR